MLWSIPFRQRLTASGNAQVTAASLLVEGGVSKSGKAIVTKTGTPGATGDPLAGLAVPIAIWLSDQVREPIW